MGTPVKCLEGGRLADALETAAEGRGLARELAIRLLDPTAPLDPLLAAAGRLRDRGKGKVVTYSRKAFLPLTNLCRDRCGYCAFRRDPDDADGSIMTPEQVLAIVKEGARLGCMEALFSLGDAPEMVFAEARPRLEGLGHRRTIEYLRAACARGAAPRIPHEAPPRPTGRPGGGRTPEDSVHHGHPGGDRRDGRRAPGFPAGDSRGPAAIRAHPGSDYPDLPREAGDSHGRPARAFAGSDAPGHGSGAADSGSRHEPAGPTESHAGLRASAGCGDQRLGRGFAADPGLHQSRSALAPPEQPARDHGSARVLVAAAASGVSWFIFDRPGHLPAEISDRIRSAMGSDGLVPTAREGARVS